MGEESTRAILDRLHDQEVRLAAQGRELARLRAACAPARRWWPGARLAALGILAVLVAAVPLATLAATTPPFVDLNPGSVHNGNIDAIYAAGITTGCIPYDPANPATTPQYCPNGTVTREEMASFLARTAGLGSNAPVANAARVALSAAAAGGPAYAADELTRFAVAPISRPTVAAGTPFASVQLVVTKTSYARVGASFTALLDPVNAANTNAANFPCRRDYQLRQNGAVVTNATRFSITNKALQPNDPPLYPAHGVNWIFTLQPGTYTFDVLQATTQGGCVEAPQYGFLTAELLPFDGAGAVAH